MKSLESGGIWHTVLSGPTTRHWQSRRWGRDPQSGHWGPWPEHEAQGLGISQHEGDPKKIHKVLSWAAWVWTKIDICYIIYQMLWAALCGPAIDHELQVTCFSLKTSLKILYVCLESLSYILPGKPVFLLLAFSSSSTRVSWLPKMRRLHPPCKPLLSAYLSWHCDSCGPGGEDRSSWSLPAHSTHSQDFSGGSLLHNNRNVTIKEHTSNAAALS